MGNVALDVARILAKTPAEFAGSDIVAHALDALAASRIERIVLLGRRGPHQIMMTPKELGELGELERAAPHVAPADLPTPEEDAILEPGLRKSVATCAPSPRRPSISAPRSRSTIEFAFLSRAQGLASASGKVEAIEIEKTRLVHGQAEGTGEIERIPADLVVSCIGYRTSPIPGVPFDERAGRFANDEGRILPGLYCVGWARRGPTGTIGTNRPDGYTTAEHIAEDVEAGILGRATKQGGADFDALAAQRGLEWSRFQRLEEDRGGRGERRPRRRAAREVRRRRGDDQGAALARHPEKFAAGAAAAG